MIEPHRIAAQFFNRPLLLTETSARTISSFLLSRFEMRGGGDMSADDKGETRQFFAPVQKSDGTMEASSPRASRFYGEYVRTESGAPTPYRITEEGTAIVSIIGELVNRGAWVGASSGLVSYEGTRYAIGEAARSKRVSQILLDIDSPGGEAVGAFEIGAFVRQVAAEKPVLAVVNGMAASAAYAIASNATRIVSIPTGLTGSIGVVMMHLDLSEMLSKAGVKPTFIFAGAHKVDGNPYEALPDDVRARMQGEIDQFYSMFVASVAAGRQGLMSADAIRGTEARIFMGEEALSIGLTDQVGSFDEVMDALAAPATRISLLGRGTRLISGAPKMADDANKPTTVEEDPKTPQADPAAAPADEEGKEPAAAAAVADPALTFADLTPGALAQGDPAAAGANPPAAPVTPSSAAPAGIDAAVMAERERASQINGLAAQAARLGVTFDAAKAIAGGVDVGSARKSILDAAAGTQEAAALVTTAGTAVKLDGAENVKTTGKSPLVAEAEKTAAKQLQQKG